MNRPHFRLAALMVATAAASLAQTLYVPGGTVGASSNSNVGIGTSNPQAKLDVNGDVRLGGFTGADADEWPRIVWYRDTANGWDEGLIKVSSARGAFGRAGYGIHMDGGRHFGFFSSGWNTLFDIEGGTGRTYIKGAVGVGTTAPMGQLELFSSSTTQLRLHRSSVAEMSLGIYGGNGAYFSTNADSFRFLTNSGGGGATGGSEVVRITSAGNLGIGDTNPGEKIVVSGNALIKGEIFVERDNDDARVLFHDPGTAWYAMGTDYSDGSKFKINYGRYPGDAVHFVLTPSGDLGLGTTSPSHKLTVNGTIHAKEVIVETGWADYVFADDYRLAPLSEVEAHIKEHKHLPGIPSASEVAEQGVSMGEMQARMMAKIEELTLHVIEQEKRAAEREGTLRREISDLRAEIVRASASK